MHAGRARPDWFEGAAWSSCAEWLASNGEDRLAAGMSRHDAGVSIASPNSHAAEQYTTQCHS